MPNKRTRERHLAKLAHRRQAGRRRKKRQRILAIVVSALVLVGAGALAFSEFRAKKSTSATSHPTPSASPTASVACGAKVPAAAAVKKKEYKKPPRMSISTNKTYTATMVTSCGTIVLRLEPKLAPNTVNSIVFLADHHFYNGVTFHRIARGFVIQGGDPLGTGSGGPGYTTLDKPPSAAKYPKGTVAMAKTGTDPAGTAGSQFFIVTGSNAQGSLAPAGQGPQYAIVGTVIKGINVVDRIAALPIVGGASDGQPAQKIYIDRITIKVS